MIQEGVWREHGKVGWVRTACIVDSERIKIKE